MKKSLLLLVALFIFTSVALKAQSPQKINFQSIVRNTSGVIVSNKSVKFKITILADSTTGTPVYSETHLKTTDAIGLVSLQIGSGTVTNGVFSSLNWGNASHFIKLEADFTGGSTYVILGTQELMSVPYAMYAAKTDTASLNLTNRFAEKAPINNPEFTGTVGGITKAMVDGLDRVDNTSDEDKPVSSLTQTALAAKAPINNPTFTGTVGGITKAMVDGLDRVDNTSDEDKPVSSLTQSALAAKAPINNPEFTGTVSGIDKSMVGLDRVDNTLDMDKPVSSLTQSAINTKVNISDTMTMLANYKAALDMKFNKSDFPSGNQDGDFLYWSQGSWTSLPPGEPGESIIIGQGGIPTWGCIIPNTVDTTMSNLGQTLVVNTPITPIRIRTTGVTDFGQSQQLPQGLSASWAANVITISGTPTQAGISMYFISLQVSCGEEFFVEGSIQVTPATTVPDAPTGVVATAGNGSASVAFVAPNNDGGSSITGYTVTSNPGNFTATGTTSPLNVTGLTNGTYYTFTVVATNAVGSSLPSNPSTAVRPATVPDAPTGVVATAGNGSASVAFVAPNNDGGSSITGYTVTSNPGNFTATGTTSPLNVTGLTNGTAYTFTVVATNAVGSSAASAASAAVTPTVASACPTPTVQDIDGNIYNTVSIGNQCWTKENLRVSRYNDGTLIPIVTSGWDALTTGVRSWYDNDSTAYENPYGNLYNWYAAAGIITTGGTPTNNICPTGWHVPTDAKWTILTDTLGGLSVAGGKMKSMGTTYWSSESAGTDDSSGFSGLPGGFRYSDGSFFIIRFNAFFWSATEFDYYYFAWLRDLFSYIGLVFRYYYLNKSVGASVRCLRD